MRSEATVKRMLTTVKKELEYTVGLLGADGVPETRLMHRIRTSLRTEVQVLEWMLGERTWHGERKEG